MRERTKLYLWILLGMICFGGIFSNRSVNISAKTTEQDTNTVIQEQSDGQEYRPGKKKAPGEDLFEDYLENANEKGVQRKIRKIAGNKLTGLNKGIYTKLMGDIEEVAAGTRASTLFEVNLDDIGEYITKWTASDLGVDSLIEDNDISKEAFSAFTEKENLNLQLILTALLADNPYGLYWYDKTSETHSSPIPISVEYDDEIDDWVIYYHDEDPSQNVVTFSFPVAAEYSSGEYIFNTEIGQSVSKIAEKANAIVSEYSQMTDYDKLDAYRYEICDMVSYNQKAVDEGAPYGNPWQIIWVFDEDKNTNVVCEGYSKAFQYLCNLTDFSEDIGCITVSGSMHGGTGEGSHMWNIVTMEDGKNYLVDVTNCDSGSIGAPSRLFLTGMNYSEDKYNIVIDGKTITYRYNNGMMTIYDPSDLAIAAASYPRPAHTHSWSSWKPLDDTSHQRICELNKTHIETKAHEWDNGMITTEPSVSTPGVRTFTCSACGKTRTEEIPPTKEEKVKPVVIRVKSIKLTGISHNIAAGKSIQLTATVLPKNAKNKKLRWTTSDSKVAIVTQTGKVTIKKKTGGKSVTIKAAAIDGSGKYAAWKIKSMKGFVKAVKISGKKTVKAGKTLKLKATVKATKGANKTIQWTTGNKKYATVNSKGIVKALAAGKGKTVKITASATDGSGKKKSISIKIK